MQIVNPLRVFHICSREVAAAIPAQGSYCPPSLAAEGFIHLSTEAQVQGVLTSFYAGQSGLVLLVIDAARLTAELKFEPPAPVQGRESPAGDELFPHLYGALNPEAIVEVRELT